MERIWMEPIGRVATCYPEKFGVPRQPGMAPSAQGRLVFEPEFRREEAVRGLEGFSHVWIVFLFHQVKEAEVRLSVRPPRLGGNEKLGVFATRSPFRPNRIGLSVCKLDRIDLKDEEAPVLELSGVDLVDGSPVLDVKPYLPYAECLAEATGAFAGGPPDAMEVVIAEEARDDFEGLGAQQRQVILETLRWDARPAYHDQEGRRYFLRVDDLEVSWEFRGGRCRVMEISFNA